MRIFTLILSAILITLISSRVLASTCKIVTGYGTAIGHGKDLNEAKDQARLKCGSELIDQYFAQRRKLAEDVKDDLVLACVNLECQK